jgi:hypothetical protein
MDKEDQSAMAPFAADEVQAFLWPRVGDGSFETVLNNLTRAHGKLGGSTLVERLLATARLWLPEADNTPTGRFFSQTGEILRHLAAVNEQRQLTEARLAKNPKRMALLQQNGVIEAMDEAFERLQSSIAFSWPMRLDVFPVEVRMLILDAACAAMPDNKVVHAAIASFFQQNDLVARPLAIPAPGKAFGLTRT